MTAPALTVVGLDAATFDVIDPMLAAGELPAIAKLVENGARGRLRSTTHPLTPLAWTTMVTGVNAGAHGIWDFTERDETGHHLRLVNGSFRGVPTLWERLTGAHRRVGIVNVPFTWPAGEVDGFMISGLDAAGRAEDAVFPSELARELRRRFGRVDLDHRFPLDANGRFDLDLVRRACDARCRALAWLVARFEPELVFCVFMSADHVHHLCWPEWEERGLESRVAAVYRILDDAVAAAAQATGGDDVMLVSDHGGGSLDGVVNLNAWLEREGFLAFDPHADRRRRAVNESFRIERRLPAPVRSVLKRRLPGVRDWALEHREFSIVDWTRTQAFSYGTFGNVVVNLEGRERHGIVPPGDYERVRDEIARRARELRGPDGEAIVAAVHRREDLFAGPLLERLPDLVIEFDEYRWLGKGPLTHRPDGLWDSIEIEPGSSEAYVGSHRPDGVVVLSGPSARPGVTLEARIEDVAPTIFYLLGEPIPTAFEGRLLVEGIDESLVDLRPPEYADEEATVGALGRHEYAEGGAAEVEERLRSLGYVE